PKPAQPRTDQPKPVQNTDKPAVQKPADHQPKKDFHKPDTRNNHNNQHNRPPKKDEPAKPVNEDMLKMLADKFKKG
ncbi:MAG TPA: hypothetical protein VK671_01055, partial [Mucilaginibacter sp.]|nr:hypothetical protein [Mucilaginibacter sp.]